jgi:mRNA interferase MazF
MRLSLDPTPGSGLRVPSQVLVDKILPRDKCGAVIGHIGDEAVLTLNQMLTVVLGLAD